MSTSTKRPYTISQTTGSYASGKYYRSWTDLGNLKADESGTPWAECGKSGTWIGGKNGTYPRPAPLKLTNFKFSIPSTAKISKITVYYRHYKPKVSGAYPTINAPTIDLLNVSADAKKGSAVPTSSTEYSVSWNISPSVSKVNSSSFGVSINYPANTSTNPGQVRLRNVRIVVTYKTVVTNTSSSSSSSIPVYTSPGTTQVVIGSDGSVSNANNSISISKTGANVSKSKVYFGETVDITLTLSASSKITAAALMLISIPDGVQFIGKKSGNGTVDEGIWQESQSNEHYYWVANFSNSSSVSVTFTVKIVSLGTKVFTFRESTTSKQSTVKVISESPPTILFWEETNNITTTEDDVEITIGCFAQVEGIENSFTVTFPSGVTVTWDDSDFTVTRNNNMHTITKTLDQGENHFTCALSFPDVGKYEITAAGYDNTISRTIIVKPSNLTIPYFTRMMADEYVLDRLGNSKEYTLSSLMQLDTAPEDETLVAAYDYNYRLGVFNTNFPDVSAQNSVNIINVDYWRELEGGDATVTVLSGGTGIRCFSVGVFGLNTEFTNSKYYTLTFELSLPENQRCGFLLFGDPNSNVTNKHSWYGIITDVGNTFIEAYDSEGNPTKLYTGSKNYFKQNPNKNIIKIIRENDMAFIFINDELFYTLNNLSNCYNTIGLQKWESYYIQIKDINLGLDIEHLNGYLLENAEWSQPISVPNVWEDIKVNFHYSDEYPLIFLITGEYIEANAEEISLKYTYPCLMEADYRENAELPGLYEYPIKQITGIEGVCSIDLQPGQVTNVAKLYDIDLTNFLESDDDNRVIQGVSVLVDVLTCDNPVSIMCNLTSPSFPKEGTRSLNIESVFLEEDIFQGVVNLGGSFDLWGLDFDDFKLSSLEDLTIDFQLLNNFEQATHIEFNNLRIVFYYVDLDESKIIAKVNGIDLRYYNVFIQNAIVKPGTNNDVKYLEVEGTDSNLAYRSNIKEKEIEMDIRVPGCDIEETTAYVERLSKLLSNKRNKFNKPILNEIEFSHYPNRVWEYILEDELDLSAEYTEYEGKIKLIVPSGTAYSKEPTLTSAAGTNSGLAKVNPVIRIIAQGTDITVKESISNQEWRLTDDTLKVGDLIRIDCAERKAYKIVGADDEYSEEDSDEYPDVDITSKVDFNSDWFLIHEDYNFECENTAIIQSVTFNERW